MKIGNFVSASQLETTQSRSGGEYQELRNLLSQLAEKPDQGFTVDVSGKKEFIALRNVVYSFNRGQKETKGNLVSMISRLDSSGAGQVTLFVKSEAGNE